MGIVSHSSRLPAWAERAAAKEKVARSLAERGQAQNDPSVVVRHSNSERVTQDISTNRAGFIGYRSLDEDPKFDKALGQVGHYVDDHVTADFSGTSLDGSMQLDFGDSLLNITYDQSRIDYQQVYKNGHFRGGKLDLNKPKSSFDLSSKGFDEALTPVPVSPHFQATVNGADFLEALPQGHEENLFREIFLDGSKSMTATREGFMTSIQDSLSTLNLNPKEEAKLRGHFAQLNAATPRRVYQDLRALADQDKQNEALAELTEKAALWRALEDFPKLKADGILRSQQYYVAPAHMMAQMAALDWEFDEPTGLPIADTIVVGGGPGGLASAYHLAERGTRTVMFEAGHIGQGFSDAGAQSVHQLRTNGAASNLIYTGNANQLGVDISLHRHLAGARKKCNEARQDWSEASGEELHGLSHVRGSESSYPAHRSELFEHMSHVAHGLASHYPDTLVSENSPVSKIEKVPGSELFKVTTERGHEVLTRSLVMATGFVGGDGEHARSLSIFQTLEDQANSGVTVLPNDHDLFRDNDTLDQELLVFSERLIGRPEIRERVKDLPAGSRLAVIGGGESATKGALEALHLNPDIVLDLYTSAPLEPYQTQIPTNVIAPVVTEGGIRFSEVADKTLEEVRNFRTPVTSDTLNELLELESQGRVRIHELGKRFNERTVEVTPKTTNGSTRLEVNLTDPEVAANLRKQREEWVNSGLYGEQPPTGDPAVLPPADMVMVAAGYDSKSRRAGPLLKQLEAQDLIEFEGNHVVYGEDGLTSSKNPMVSFNTAGAVAMASDTAIPGRAVRAYRLAQNFNDKLPGRDKPTDRVPSGLEFGGIDTRSDRQNFLWSKDEILKFIDNGGLVQENIDRLYKEANALEDPAERASAVLRVDAQVQFPGPNSALRSLMIRAHEVPESLTPQERLMWERAQTVQARLTA